MHTAASGSQTQLGGDGDTFAGNISDRMTPTPGSQEIAYLQVLGRSPLKVRRKVLGYCNMVEVPIKRRRNDHRKDHRYDVLPK